MALPSDFSFGRWRWQFPIYAVSYQKASFTFFRCGSISWFQVVSGSISSEWLMFFFFRFSLNQVIHVIQVIQVVQASNSSNTCNTSNTSNASSASNESNATNTKNASMTSNASKYSASRVNFRVISFRKRKEDTIVSRMKQHLQTDSICYVVHHLCHSVLKSLTLVFCHWVGRHQDPSFS